MGTMTGCIMGRDYLHFGRNDGKSGTKQQHVRCGSTAKARYMEQATRLVRSCTEMLKAGLLCVASEIQGLLTTLRMTRMESFGLEWSPSDSNGVLRTRSKRARPSCTDPIYPQYEPGGGGP